VAAATDAKNVPVVVHTSTMTKGRDKKINNTVNIIIINKYNTI
jgi:hypothetical protein